MKYICNESFYLDEYDCNGFALDSQTEVHKSEIYETFGDEDLKIATEPAVHLELVHENYIRWIEIDPETLEQYFSRCEE